MRAYARIAVLLLIAVTSVAGCSDSIDPVETPSQSATPTPTPTPTNDAAAEDDAAVEDVFMQYIDAVVQMENGPTADPALLFGLTSDEVTAEHMSRALQYEENGIRRVGAPDVGDPVIAVDGDGATLEVCFDEDGWTAEVEDGTAVTSTPRGPTPRAYRFARADGEWVVAELLPQNGAEIRC